MSSLNKKASAAFPGRLCQQWLDGNESFSCQAYTAWTVRQFCPGLLVAMLPETSFAASIAVAHEEPARLLTPVAILSGRLTPSSRRTSWPIEVVRIGLGPGGATKRRRLPLAPTAENVERVLREQLAGLQTHLLSAGYTRLSQPRCWLTRGPAGELHIFCWCEVVLPKLP